jgi:hypothetical protein
MAAGQTIEIEGMARRLATLRRARIGRPRARVPDFRRHASNPPARWADGTVTSIGGPTKAAYPVASARSVR